MHMTRLSTIIGAALIGLLHVQVARATTVDVSFSFTNNQALDVAGTVTGTIYGLTEGGTGEQPTSVTINSAPSGTNPLGSAFPITYLPATFSGEGLTVDIKGVITGGALDGDMVVSLGNQEFFDLFVTGLTFVFGTTTPDVNVINRSACLGVEGEGCLSQSVVPTASPLPAALPLFATGLGAIGLFGWRRKRKAAAVLAAA
jgi:hypothetical protein